MAILENNGTQLVIDYYQIYFASNRWPELGYGIQFLYKGKNLLNDLTIETEHDDTCGFIELIYKVLSTNKADYWDCITEPGFILTIIPGNDFPEIVHEKINEFPPKANSNEYFTVIASVDSCCFGNLGSERGNGLSLYLIVTKEKLEQFVLDLEKEFKERWQEFINNNSFDGIYPIDNYGYWENK